MTRIIFVCVTVLSFLVVGIYWPHLFPFFFFGFIGMLALAGFRDEINHTLQVLFNPVHTLDDARIYLDGRVAAFRQWTRRIRAEEGLEQDAIFINRLVGHLLTACILVSFIFAEAYLTTETLRAFSSADIPQLTIPGAQLNPDLVLAICLLLGPVFWGMVLTDLFGKTSFGPWLKLSEEHQAQLVQFAWGTIAGFCCLALLLGIFRGLMHENSVSPLEPYMEYPAQNITDLAQLEQTAVSGVTDASAFTDTRTGPDKFRSMVGLILYPSLALLILVTAIAAGYSVTGVAFMAVLAGVMLVQTGAWFGSLFMRLAHITGTTVGGAFLGVVNLCISAGTLMLSTMGLSSAGNNSMDDTAVEHHGGSDSKTDAGDVEEPDGENDLRTEDLSQQDEFIQEEEQQPGHAWNPFH